jgi:hypothetical protein
MNDQFNINIHLRIVTPEETNQFLVFLDEKGEIPKFSLLKNEPLDRQIFDKLAEYLIQDIYILFITKQIASISNNRDTIDIVYNFISTSTRVKSGSFVKFNQQSLELYRFMNSQT